MGIRACICAAFGFAAMLAVLLAACSGTHDPQDAAPPVVIGEAHAGQYNLGPVEWSGSYWNSCAPYPAEVQAEEGGLLAGLALAWNGAGQMCDACVEIATAKGKSVLARVVTTGETQGPNDIDLSKAAFDAINQGEYPRDMTWRVVQCPATGNIAYQFQTGANVYWTSLWVRNVKWPLEKVEVKSARHADWFALTRGNDGTYTDAGGFGSGAFTLRVTSIDTQSVEDVFSALQPGALVPSGGQFH